MITSLRNKIYELGLTVEGLTTGNLFFKLAKKGITKDYCVFSEIANPSSGRTTKSRFEESHIQFTCYYENQSAGETLVKKIREKFDDAESSFSLTDYHVIRIDWMLSRDVQLEEMNQFVVQYKFRLQKK